MWPNPQETSDLVTFSKKSLMENFIFCAVNVTRVYGKFIDFFLHVSTCTGKR